MKCFRNFIDASLICILFLFVTSEAHAYIDPGTGSYIFQLVIAALLGALFALKVFWNNVKAFFSSLLFGRQKNPKNDR